MARCGWTVAKGLCRRCGAEKCVRLDGTIWPHWCASSPGGFHSGNEPAERITRPAVSFENQTDPAEVQPK